jgi:hypothetical protein
VRKRLILIELNEINFDVVQQYLATGSGNLPALRHLIDGRRVRTTSEKCYEQLEPWIQWASVHTGKDLEEHGVFRLGDIAGTDTPQFFEELERRGWNIGAISPINAANRLRSPAYFIPDPWTRTPTDGSWWSRSLGAAISQAVNDNSQAKLRPLSIFHLALGLVRFARPRNYLMYLRLALGARKAPWRKALFLDLFLHDLHLRFLATKSPDFSTLFVNAGAHIQHHYFLNAAPLRAATPVRNPSWYVSPDSDPVAEMLGIYDRIVSDYQALAGWEVIIATGLSQKPYDRVKFYYRLKDHASFLRSLGLRFHAVLPRMTRDFLIEFDDAASATLAEARLSGIAVGEGGLALFGEIENRGSSLFVTLTYPDEISDETEFVVEGVRSRLARHVVFVAIKNGMHQEVGFAFFSEGVARFAPADGAHVKSLYASVMAYFA